MTNEPQTPAIMLDPRLIIVGIDLCTPAQMSSLAAELGPLDPDHSTRGFADFGDQVQYCTVVSGFLLREFGFERLVDEAQSLLAPSWGPN